MKSVRLYGTLIIIFFLLAVLNGVSAVSAAGGQAGGAAAYLKMGAGARALGMGGAFIGVADDATTTYWNPAGIARLESRQLSTMHADLTLDRSYNFINMVNPGSCYSWGISWIRAGVDSIQGYDALGNPTTVFEDKEDCFMASVSKRLKNGVDLGLSIKYLSHELFTNSADGFGFDLGLLYDVSDRFRVGLVGKELGAELEWDTASGQTDDVPSKLALGCSYKLWDGALLALDISKVEDMDTEVFVGGEALFREKFAIRAGMSDEDFTAGAGIMFSGWEIDYAFQEQELGDIHRVSALFKFDTGKKKISAPIHPISVKVQKNPSEPAAKTSDSVDGMLKTAENALGRKEFTKAAGMYEAVLKADPTRPDIRYKLGMAYMKAGETDKARVVFSEALKMEPDSKYARYAELLAR
ncbi:MAG: PorV/PorQ family protein [bacterium]|jgi:hypothetical protein|nr:PorV/PorQ family protein [bacterium]